MADTAALRKSAAGGEGPGGGGVGLSVDEVEQAAGALAASGPGVAELAALADGEPFVAIDGLVAGYGKMEILHGFDLRLCRGQSLCLIGPNGAGKSTVLNSIHGFTHIMSGTIRIADRDVTHLASHRKLRDAGVAYVLQDNSVFPEMSVEENLFMGGYLMPRSREAKRAAERAFERYPRLGERRRQRAGVLSGGERRLLEISRALVMDPAVLLVDEPSIGLEPRYIDMVFSILADLQKNEGRTIVMVEQNAKKGLEFADLGYVLVSGRIALAGRGRELLANPEVGRLFLGG
ncbi:MAG TPA: ABC transporter ATP-binding protein [Casimicrobiaceae bacterium]|nr:ABC transporter ATP-binding protein [Casimicrobiaceae bacterium]